jgi:hypothetical protein
VLVISIIYDLMEKKLYLDKNLHLNRSGDSTPSDNKQDLLHSRAPDIYFKTYKINKKKDIGLDLPNKPVVNQDSSDDISDKNTTSSSDSSTQDCSSQSITSSSSSSENVTPPSHEVKPNINISSSESKCSSESSSDNNIIFKNKSKQKKDKNDKDRMVKKIISKQLQDVHINKKLMFNDIKRICKNITTDMFDKIKCCIWQGHVTNMNKKKKGRYINFYFSGKKRALHRLLYSNFIGNLTNYEYLKFACDNKGICCNINHLKKFKYQKKTGNDDNKEFSSDTDSDVKIKANKVKNDVIVKNSKSNDKITLTFD